MKVRGLDGREYSLDLRGKVPLDNDDRPRSALHLRARALLTQLFPVDVRAEEVQIPGEWLFLDFFLPARKLAVEVQGRQHGCEIGFFHPTRLAFFESRARDNRKADWCELNGFRLVLLEHDGTDRDWAERLVGADAGP